MHMIDKASIIDNLIRVDNAKLLSLQYVPNCNYSFDDYAMHNGFGSRN